MGSLRSMAAMIRSTAATRPVICSGAWRSEREGERKRAADSASVMPRRPSRGARIRAAAVFPRSAAISRRAEVSDSTTVWSAVLRLHCMLMEQSTWRFAAKGAELRSADGRWRPSPHAFFLYFFRLAFFVLIRFVHGQATELFRDVKQALVALIPLGAHFTKEHGTVISPAQLKMPYLAGVSAQPAGVFHIVAVREF